MQRDYQAGGEKTESVILQVNERRWERLLYVIYA